MAIKFTGNDDFQDIFTLGSNQATTVTGGAGASNDMLYINARQVATVSANSDATQTIVLEAGVEITEVTSNILGTKIVFTNTDGLDTVVNANAANTFKIGEATYTADELVAFSDANANYTVTGNEKAAAAASAPVISDADSDITIQANVVKSLDTSVTVTDAENDFTAGTIVFTDSTDKTDTDYGDFALNGTTAYMDTTSNYVIALDANGDEQVVGTVVTATNNDKMTIKLNANADAGTIETLIESATYTAADTGDITLNVTLTDAAGNAMTHSYDASVLAETPLAFSALSNDLVVVARTDTATVNVDLGMNATVNTDDATALNVNNTDLVGGTLEIALSGTTDAADQLTFKAATATTAGIRMMGDVLVYDADGTDTNAATNEEVIGTLSGTGTADSPYVITFMTGVTNADVNYLLNNLEFDTSDTAAIGERTVTFTLTDNTETNVATASTSMFVVNSFMTLTTANDTGADFVGTADTDAYQAANDALDSGDVLDGGAGTDFLLAELTETSVAPTVSNVEQFRLSANDTTSDNEISFANVTHDTDGAVTISVDGTENVIVTNVGTSVGKIDLSNAGNAEADTTDFTLLDTVADKNGVLDYTGSNGADTLTMAETLNNEDSLDGGTESETGTKNAAVTVDDALTADINGLDATTGALDIKNFESITLTNVTAASTINAAGISGDGLKTADGSLANDTKLAIEGTDLDTTAGVSEVTITDINDTINQIDVSGAADVTVTFAADADVTLISSGAGDLTANMGNTLDGADTLTGGAGENTVNATFNGQSAAAAVSIAATGIAFTISDETVVVTSSTAIAVGDIVSFGTVTAANALNAAAAEALSGNEFIVTASDATTFTFENTVQAANTSASSAVAASTFVDVSLDGNTAIAAAAAIETINITADTNASTFDFTKMKAAAINLQGDADVTIDNITSTTALTINAADDATVASSTATDSEFTGNLTLDIDAAGDHIISGGQGDDTFTFSETATIDANDNIEGGAGTDTLTGTLDNAATSIDIDSTESITLDVAANTAVALNVTAANTAFSVGKTVTLTSTAASHGLTTGDIFTFGAVTATAANNTAAAAALSGNSFATVTGLNTFTVTNTVAGGTSEAAATATAGTTIDVDNADSADTSLTATNVVFTVGTTVHIASTTHGLSTGDTVTFGAVTATAANNTAAAAALSGNTFAITVVDANSYTITNTVAGGTAEAVASIASAYSSTIASGTGRTVDLANVDAGTANTTELVFTDDANYGVELELDNVDATITSIDMSDISGVVKMGVNDTKLTGTTTYIVANDTTNNDGTAAITIVDTALSAGVIVGDYISLSAVEVGSTTADTALETLLNNGSYLVTAIGTNDFTIEASLDADDNNAFDIADATYTETTPQTATMDISATADTDTTIVSGTDANQIFTGAGDDTITITSTESGAATFTTADVINAFGGDDTLTAKVDSNTGAVSIMDVETLNLEATEAMTLDLSNVTHTTAGETTLNITGGQEVTLTNPGAAISTIATDTGTAAGLIVSFDNDADRDLSINLGTGQPDTFTFAANFDNAVGGVDMGTVTITGFEAAGTTDRIIIDDNNGTDVFSNLDLKFTNYDSNSDGSNDSLKISLISGDGSEGVINLIGLTSSDISVGDDIILA